MYNDYYLQQILTETNEINETTENIYTNQQQLISGDYYTLQQIKLTNETINKILMFLIAFIIIFSAYMIHHIVDYTWKEN